MSKIRLGNLRIEIGDKNSYLVYRKGPIQFIRLIRAGVVASGLSRAKERIRQDVRDLRCEINMRSDRAPGYVLRLLKQKRGQLASRCRHAKTPPTLTRHIGVEIEFLSNRSQSTVCRELAAAGLANHVHLKTDGSVKAEPGSDECGGSCYDTCNCAYCPAIHTCDNETKCVRRSRDEWTTSQWRVGAGCEACGTETLDNGDGTATEVSACTGHCLGHPCVGPADHPNYECTCECICNESDESGHEIAVVAESDKIADVVTRVCAVLAQCGATVNSTCGLHVHLDMRSTGKDHAEQAFSDLVSSCPLLYAMVPKSRAENQYCQVNREHDWSESCYKENRYWGVNPNAWERFQTLEVRIHSGTTDPNKIRNWIALLSAIAYREPATHASMPSTVRSLRDLLPCVDLTPELVGYIQARCAKHNPLFDAALPINWNEPSTQIELELAA